MDMNILKRSLRLLLAGVIPLLGTAQSFPVEPVEFSTENFSLPGTPVMTLCQTDDGFIWAGVFNHGLIRYAGNDVAFFGTDRGVSSGSVHKIVQDQRGNLWVGCKDLNALSGGVTYSSAPLVDGVLPDDLHFRDRAGEVSLPHTNVMDLDVDTHGNIWAATDSLLAVYRWSGDTTLEVVRMAWAEQEDDPGKALTILPLQDGTVWVSFVTGRVSHLQLSDGSGAVQVLRTLQRPHEGANELSAVDAGGRLRGLYARRVSIAIDPVSGEVTSDTIHSQGSVVRPLDRQTLLIPTREDGILLRDADTGADLGSLGVEQGLSSGSVFDVLVSREGDLWIADLNGLYRMPADFRAFAHYTDAALGGNAPLLSDPNINAVITDVWLQNARGGRDTVTLAGLMDGLLVIPRHGAPYTLNGEDGLPLTTVMGAVQDSAGRIYLTSLRDGVVCIRTGGPPHPYADSSKPFPAFHPGYTIDYIWTAPMFVPSLHSLPGGRGPSLWSGLKDQIWVMGAGATQMQIQVPFARSVSYPFGIYQDAAGHVHAIGQGGWVRTRRPFTQGVYDSLAIPANLSEYTTYYDIPTSDSLFESIPLRFGDREFGAVYAHLLVKDKLWVAVDSQLLIVDPITVQVEESISLGGESCSALSQNSEMVWAGTTRGLFGIRKSDRQVEWRLLREDGLMRDDNWTPKGLAVNDLGQVFQSTPKGLQSVDPKWLRAETAPRPVYLTRESYAENDWGRNELAVNYAMLSYREQADEVYYQTRLAGYDEDWSERTTETSLRYTNLSAFLFPKTYQMEVRAVDYLGKPYQTATDAYPVTVKPPLYLRWWAIVIYLLLLGLAIRAYTRYRLREQERELRLREADTIRRQRDEIAAKNTENETLLKEIHHRVKNNLEVVSSLLELQSATLEDGDALDAMRAGQSRVASMGLLHQKLYQGHDMATVSMDGYLRELTDSLLETYDLNERVEVIVDVSPDLVLDVDTAVPVGLIVNELVTNSFKYAFTGVPLAGGAAGRLAGDEDFIRVSLLRENGKRVLTVSDNGGGKMTHLRQGTGFGTRLVQLLTSQLDGELREVNDYGLRTEISF